MFKAGSRSGNFSGHPVIRFGCSVLFSFGVVILLATANIHLFFSVFACLDLHSAVQESGQSWDCTVEVPGSVALVFKEGLGVPHIGSVVGVGGEHGVVSVGLGALQGKSEREVLPSGVKSLKVESIECSLVTAVLAAKYYGKGFLLHFFNLTALVCS